jgi:alpha-beta hydrolase superfamily lysophospholipase
MCPRRTPRPDTIVLIHGLHLTPLSWEGWIHRYTAAGFRVLAPAWPGMEGGVEALRRDPTPIAAQTAHQVVEHLTRVVAELDRPPVIIGHCYGGAFTQVLLDRGLGAAGVALGATPTRGVFPPPWTTIRSSLPDLRDGAVALTPRQFHYAFTNTIPDDHAAAIYQRYAVPASGRVVSSRALAELIPRSAYAINYRRPDRAPLLLVAGGADRQSPPAGLRANARKYHRSAAVTQYVEFPDRCHFTLGQDGWTDLADHILTWAITHTNPD